MFKFSVFLLVNFENIKLEKAMPAKNEAIAIDAACVLCKKKVNKTFIQNIWETKLEKPMKNIITSSWVFDIFDN